MVRPVLMAVDDEPVALRVLERELGKRYGADYEVVCAATPEVGLGRLERLKVDGGQLALVLADQWMPSMTRCIPGPCPSSASWGAAGGAHQLGGSLSAAEPILQASALGQIDDWAAKPWGPGMSSSTDDQRVPERVGAAAPSPVRGLPGRRRPVGTPLP